METRSSTTNNTSFILQKLQYAWRICVFLEKGKALLRTFPQQIGEEIIIQEQVNFNRSLGDFPVIREFGQRNNLDGGICLFFVPFFGIFHKPYGRPPGP